jgi:2-polyprenyl-3-methyl-5-hydroxy-6-metoxy-1,4-benzoquinol methylase
MAMVVKEWYQQWFSSPYYHKLYFSRDSAEAEKLIGNLLQHLQPPAGSRMLDVACGKGRHSVLLAKGGHDVTGIDLSAESIQQAKQHENERLHFYVHDMRRSFFVNYFHYAFNFFTSFGYFDTRREHDDAMRTIAASLQPGGMVLFDYLNVHYVEDRLVHNEIKTIDETVYEIHRWHDASYFYKRMIVTDPTLNTPMQATEKVAKFSLGDFTEMMAYQKIQVTEVFGDYNLNPYNVRKTPRMIIIGKKF